MHRNRHIAGYRQKSLRKRPGPAAGLAYLGGQPLTSGDSLPILTFPPTMKGGDPVSFTKRCHLAGIAR
jgi:hypothetical protein